MVEYYKKDFPNNGLSCLRRAFECNIHVEANYPWKTILWNIIDLSKTTTERKLGYTLKYACLRASAAIIRLLGLKVNNF